MKTFDILYYDDRGKNQQNLHDPETTHGTPYRILPELKYYTDK